MEIRKLLIVGIVTIVAIVGIFYMICITWNSTAWNTTHSEIAEGVRSLVVYFQKDYHAFNYTLAAYNLSVSGYSYEVQGKSDYWDWRIQVYWPVPDIEYAQKYSSEFIITFYGYEPANTSLPKSYAIVSGFGPMVEGNVKKEQDKQLAKQAVYEVSSIIGVSLNWSRHVYHIGWMSMTSEGEYEEQYILFSDITTLAISSTEMVWKWKCYQFNKAWDVVNQRWRYYYDWTPVSPTIYTRYYDGSGV